MTVHEFTVIASGLDPDTPGFEDRFFEAGCDDATLSHQRGLILAEFAREAPTMADAIVSAIDNVRAAGATVERIEPDYLVSLSDIADRSGLSRQAISLYAKGERGAGFPAPAVKVMSDRPLWDWYAVAHWLHEKALLDRKAVIAARLLREVNTALIAAHVPKGALQSRLAAIEAGPG